MASDGMASDRIASLIRDALEARNLDLVDEYQEGQQHQAAAAAAFRARRITTVLQRRSQRRREAEADPASIHRAVWITSRRPVPASCPADETDAAARTPRNTATAAAATAAAAAAATAGAAQRPAAAAARFAAGRVTRRPCSYARSGAASAADTGGDGDNDGRDEEPARRPRGTGRLLPRARAGSVDVGSPGPAARASPPDARDAGAASGVIASDCL